MSGCAKVRKSSYVFCYTQHVDYSGSDIYCDVIIPRLIDIDKRSRVVCYNKQYFIARPIERFRTEELLPAFYERIEEKGWKSRWPHLRIEAE